MVEKKITKKKEVKEEVKEVVVVQPKTLVLEGDPEQQLEFAQKASKALMKVVESKPNKVIINGKQYLEYSSWQTLARFFGATAGTEWTKPILDNTGKVVGYEARAFVNQHGEVISAAEASCMRSEKNWANSEEFAIKSMAQTRAAAKALRNAFGWVAELAGYASTPAEEMTYDNTPVAKEAVVVSTGADDSEPTAEDKKKMIVARCKRLEPKLNWKDKDEVANFVLEVTGFDLIEAKYDDIINKLEDLNETA